ncbi:MAG: hypothetical protein ACRDWA_12890 [Acidimicrobiia bacterium]
MPLVVVWLPLPSTHCTVSPRLMVTDAGAKAKLLAVMVAVALGAGAVVVVSVVVVGTVVVSAWVVVVVGARVVVVGGMVVVGEAEVIARVLVVAASVVVVVDDGGVSVVVGRGAVMEAEPATETSVETSVAPLPQAISKALSATSRRSCISGHTQEAGRRFSSGR